MKKKTNVSPLKEYTENLFFDYKHVSNHFFINTAFFFFKQDNKNIKLSQIFELFSKTFFNHEWNIVSKKEWNFYNKLEHSFLNYEKNDNSELLTIIKHLKKNDTNNLICNPEYEQTILSLNKKTNKNVSIDQVYINVFETFYNFTKKSFEEFTSIKTGFDKIDENIQFGLKRSQVSLVGSDTAIGKTRFCIKTALSVLDQKFNDKKQNLKILHVIGDNSFENIVKVYWSVENKIPLKNINNEINNNGDFLTEKSKLKNIDFITTYEESPNKKLYEKIKEKTSSKKYDLIIIDDLHLVIDQTIENNGNQLMASKSSAASKMMMVLKKLAEEQNCAILCTHITNSISDNRLNSNQLKFSMGISSACDIIIQLKKASKSANSLIYANFIKNRTGITNISESIKLFD